MVKLIKIIESKERFEVDRMLYYAIKRIYDLEVKQGSLEELMVGKQKDYPRKIDWEIAQMEKMNRPVRLLGREELWF